MLIRFEKSSAMMESFLSRHERIIRENERLRIRNYQLTRESLLLKSNGSSVTVSATEDTAQPAGSLSESTHRGTIDEEHFRLGLRPEERLTSSPARTRPPARKTEGSGNDEADSEDFGFHSQEFRCEMCPPSTELSPRLVGEIPFQLDRRILSYVFQNQKRFYGFSISNIPSKIIEASTDPLTNHVDADYRLILYQRYQQIKDTLCGLGYDFKLHPRLSEWIVNTFGILQMQPKPGSSQEMDFNNLSYLKRAIETTAPSKLHENLMLLLDCLNTLAQRDGKPILTGWS